MLCRRIGKLSCISVRHHSHQCLQFVARFRSHSLYLRRKIRRTHWLGCRVVPTAGMDTVNRKYSALGENLPSIFLCFSLVSVELSLTDRHTQSLCRPVVGQSNYVGSLMTYRFLWYDSGDFGRKGRLLHTFKFRNRHWIFRNLLTSKNVSPPTSANSLEARRREPCCS